MKHEFDMGFKECEETKVAFLYARIEDALLDLTTPCDNLEQRTKQVVKDLRYALKLSDLNHEYKF